MFQSGNQKSFSPVDSTFRAPRNIPKHVNNEASKAIARQYVFVPIISQSFGCQWLLRPLLSVVLKAYEPESNCHRHRGFSQFRSGKISRTSHPRTGVAGTSF